MADATTSAAPGCLCADGSRWFRRDSRPLSDGRRQILNFLLAGDFIGVQQKMGDAAAHGVETLTDALFCVFQRDALWELHRRSPVMGFNVTWLTAHEESMVDDTLLSVGRRSAEERIASMLFLLFKRAAALQADAGFSYAELKDFADDVRQQLLRVPDVAKVELFGVQDEKLYVEISQKRLAQLGLDLNQVLAQLGQQNAVESAGAVQTPLEVVQVRVAGQFEAVEQLRAMPIRGTSGNQLRLGDIAEIKRDAVRIFDAEGRAAAGYPRGDESPGPRRAVRPLERRSRRGEHRLRRVVLAPRPGRDRPHHPADHIRPGRVAADRRRRTSPVARNARSARVRAHGAAPARCRRRTRPGRGA